MSLKDKIQTATKQKSKIVPYNEQIVGYCQCGDCPTHEQAERGEMVFCSAGASDNVEKMVKRGCQCPTCQVFERYGLSKGYFCINGEAK